MHEQIMIAIGIVWVSIGYPILGAALRALGFMQDWATR
jgi:hypothetical protein